MSNKIKVNPIENFWKHVNILGEDDCWEWKGSLLPNGYGRYTIHHNERTVRAHKFSWEIAFGDVPDELLVCHKCDNRKCCNPKHLFLGTHLDNNKDRHNKGRDAKGEKQGTSKLTLEKVNNIRCLYRSGKYSQTKLASMFGIGQTQVSRIIRLESWTWSNS